MVSEIVGFGGGWLEQPRQWLRRPVWPGFTLGTLWECRADQSHQAHTEEVQEPS